MLGDKDLHTRVYVPEVGKSGTIYESSYNYPCRVYGVRFDKTVWPENFVATVVLHLRPCEFILLDNRKSR